MDGVHAVLTLLCVFLVVVRSSPSTLNAQSFAPATIMASALNQSHQFQLNRLAHTNEHMEEDSLPFLASATEKATAISIGGPARPVAPSFPLIPAKPLYPLTPTTSKLKEMHPLFPTLIALIMMSADSR
jgi:hypothetical protein